MSSIFDCLTKRFSCAMIKSMKDELIKENYSFEDLMRVIERLTSEDGCEWDKKQTHESILKNMTEEANEACDAILSGDISAIIEETGDVMLQTLFHADIARRNGTYTISDVINVLAKKLISRHPHVFGDKKARTAEEALAFWNDAKRNEKAKQ
ncbi:MAG: nucleotide pyrophosphohydrolase [Firmicutes bacterium]|nr:nucleotide pyrophosphohydrolase [Bacillota bacterium]